MFEETRSLFLVFSAAEVCLQVQNSILYQMAIKIQTLSLDNWSPSQNTLIHSTYFAV